MEQYLKLFKNQTDYEAASEKPQISHIVDDVELIEQVDPYGGHEYVEIGGLKWATMNIGANSVTDYGQYFQWADTQGFNASEVGSGSGKKYCGWEDYKYGNGTSSPGSTGITKYNTDDGLTILEASDDAAQAAWGGNWRIPTVNDLQSLSAAVSTAYTKVDGVYGLLCTDNTDSSKTLFFPAAGKCGNGLVDNVGSYGYYWTANLSPYSYTTAFYTGFLWGRVVWNAGNGRYSGYSIRCVAE